jgi:hypothetical protein
MHGEKADPEPPQFLCLMEKMAKASIGKGIGACGNIAPETNAAAASGAGKNVP